MENTDSPDGAQLIQRIRDRDPEALAIFIDANRGQLAGFVRSITGEHLLAVVELDDLLQEISATACTGLASAPLDQYEPMQWLQQIARRRVVDAHRFHFDAKRRDVGRQKSIHGAGNADASMMGLEQMLSISMTSASAAMSRDLRMIRVQEAISGLSDEQKDAIRMRYAEGMPTKEIAAKIGKSDAATRVLLSRSMRQLEKQLEDVKPTR
ncbi:MAG: RNA polymerase sigma factor [Rubripirellula sp.]